MGKPTKIQRMAKEKGKTERDFLKELLERHSKQTDIARTLGVTQSAVSTAFERNGFKRVIRYEIEAE